MLTLKSTHKFLMALVMVGAVQAAKPALAVTDENGISLLGVGPGGVSGGDGATDTGGSDGGGDAGTDSSGGGSGGGVTGGGTTTTTTTGTGGVVSTTVAPGPVTEDMLITSTIVVNWNHPFHGPQTRTYTVNRTFHYYPGVGWQLTGDEWPFYQSRTTTIMSNGWMVDSWSQSDVTTYF